MCDIFEVRNCICDTRVLLSWELTNQPTQCDEPMEATSISSHLVVFLDAGGVSTTIGTWDGRLTYLKFWGSSLELKGGGFSLPPCSESSPKGMSKRGTG